MNRIKSQRMGSLSTPIGNYQYQGAKPNTYPLESPQPMGMDIRFSSHMGIERTGTFGCIDDNVEAGTYSTRASNPLLLSGS